MLKPRTFREGLIGLPKYFSAEQAQGVAAVIEFDVTGAEAGRWHLIIEDDTLHVAEGAAQVPVTLTIKTPSDVWLRIMRRELGGAEAFVTGQATAVGDAALLRRLPTFFRFRVGDS